MKYFGLRFYILLNILIICALGMVFIGIISIKLTERTAIESKIAGTTAVIKAFENTYFTPGEIDDGIEFLKNALDDGSWGTIKLGDERISFKTPSARVQKKYISGSLINRVNLSRNPEITIDGLSILPFRNYKAYKIAYPIKNKGLKGTIFIYEPLDRFNKSIETNQKFLALWVVLFILLIAIFGYYLLSKTVVRPVQKLIDLTKDISHGITPINTDVGSITEINKLQNAMIKMSEEIEISKSELRINISNLEEANNKIIETQKELIASEKLASLGRLSSGVAHEIGNPLSAITGYVEVLKKGDKLDIDQKKNYIEKIETEIERINTIISTLLDYSRPKELLETNINLNEIVTSAVDLLSSQGLFKKVNLNTNLSDYPLPIRADQSQMLQVFVNLLLNSKDAMNDEGTIEISTNLTDQGIVTATVKDNGSGIEKENLDKIFDPFFTTKEPGSGTGLGLSISHRIIQQFDGNINVNSEPGVGTEFVLTFPKHESVNAKSIVN